MEQQKRRRINSMGDSFPQFSKLDEDMMMHIISFIADVPMENSTEKLSKCTLTDILPLVSKQFNAFCKSDFFWKAAMKRLCATEPFLWEEGLLQLFPPERKARNESTDKLLDNATKLFPDLNYNSLYWKVMETYIRYSGPVFYMTGAVKLGQAFGLHFFEPRYRLLIAEVMRGWPETARRGGVITASSRGLFPTFIYAHIALQRGKPACLVQVRQCMIYPDGTADVMLDPVAYVSLQTIWERPDAGHLYEASCLRLGREHSRQLEVRHHGQGRGVMEDEFHQFAEQFDEDEGSTNNNASRVAIHAILSYLLSAQSQEENDAGSRSELSHN